MPAFWLSLILILVPLPGLPELPQGTEIRVVSPNLRTIYRVWEVRGPRLVLRARPLPLPEGHPVRLIIRVGRRVQVYEGVTTADDLWIFVERNQVSFREVLRKIYGLELPEERDEPETHPRDRGRP
ncbi:hypothetical protein [Marinithermus hydrothermalis]|uniref:Uncharacterized protein n=1 Tax=Marinithermus hydrothermalis (strain DSM 14884 / JCM 11576 / T1) TaxID=869210 RepID=F2NLQ9_MARHT|nr:hypothetical protein [Marinithermus hydrothermalis]AEB10889.1 hypothetical protein Marky_0126 [Marinithermus hydrothermalis DSM 14884]